MCYELRYSKRAAAKEARKTEPQEVKETPPQTRAEERREKVTEPA